MRLQTIAISNGNGGNAYDVYTAHLAVGSQCQGIFNINGDDLLQHVEANLCLRSSSNSSVLFRSVKDIFLAPRADFFPRPDLTTAISGNQTFKYGNGNGAVLDKLMNGNQLFAQAKRANPIMNILMEGLNPTDNPDNITRLSNIQSIIDYVFSKPHLLLSVLLILRNEGGAQHLFTDAGNVPHRNQLILNMSRTNFVDKLHSGTQFGIASYFHYERRIYKSVFDLDIADYIITSISYYPTVSQGDIERHHIVNYYNSLLNNYRHSVYSFHLWRHSLYGGFAGVVGGSGYVSNGYDLRPECACKALKLQIDAQGQKNFKKGWYAVLYFPTAFYILLLYLAMEKPNLPHDNKVVNEALSKLNKIERESAFYKKFIKPFTEEIGDGMFSEILREGIQYLNIIAKSSKDYQNPIQMLWNYCKEIIVVPTHNKIVKRYEKYASDSVKITKLRNRLNTVTEYIDNKFKPTNSSINELYVQILREEQKFFNN
jgi:hypothetical protein